LDFGLRQRKLGKGMNRQDAKNAKEEEKKVSLKIGLPGKVALTYY
jgi:hypothetical protein